MESIPYSYRLIALVAFASIVSLGELAVRGRRATRWKSYGFLLAVATAVAGYGALNDVLTSLISKEYFTLFKGLGDSPTWRRETIALGAKAGFFAGVILGCVMLVASTARARLLRLEIPTLVPLLLWPALLAPLASLLLGAGFRLAAIRWRHSADRIPRCEGVCQRRYGLGRSHRRVHRASRRLRCRQRQDRPCAEGAL